MHFIRPIGDTQSPCVRVPTEESILENRVLDSDGSEARVLHLCQRDVSRHPRTAVHLYSAVRDLTHHPRGGDFDHGNLKMAGGENSTAIYHVISDVDVSPVCELPGCRGCPGRGRRAASAGGSALS